MRVFRKNLAARRERPRSASPRISSDARVPLRAFSDLRKPREFKRTLRPRRQVRQRSASPRIDTKRYKIGREYATAKGHKLDNFVETISSNAYETDRFKFRRMETKFILKNLAECDEPENMLASAFARCIEEACAKSVGAVKKIGISIHCANLESPIELPFREPWQNGPATVLHEFQRVEQSKRANSLYGEPISVIVSTIGSNSGGYRLKADVVHNVNQNLLLKIENSDAYCLFRALEAARMHKLIGKPGGLTSAQFYHMMKGVNQRKQTGNHALGRYAKLLMSYCDIPFRLPSYSAEEYVQKVQDFYERTYPGMFRISVFSSIGTYKPIYVGTPEHYIFDICVYYDDIDKHYHGIRCINTFFGKDFYCIDCARPFHHQREHTYKCTRKCNRCGTIGPLRPCAPDGKPAVQCADCNKTFDNQACYERHKGAQCKAFKYCLQCGVHYDMHAIRRYSESGKHECEYKFCKKCCVYHKKNRDCCVEPLAKPELKDARFCFFDIECTQDRLVDGSKRFRYRHECNAVHATIVCTRCIDAGKWKADGTGGCEICDSRREHWWSEAEGNDPLREFLNFLFYGLNKDFPTYVLGHFSGRYDLHAVNTEIYRMGGLAPSVIRSGHRIYQMILSKPGTITETIFKD